MKLSSSEHSAEERHRSIADRRLHMLTYHTTSNNPQLYVFNLKLNFKQSAKIGFSKSVNNLHRQFFEKIFPDISFRRIRVYREKKHPALVLCEDTSEGGASRSRVRGRIAAEFSGVPLGEGAFWVKAIWINLFPDISFRRIRD